MQWIKVLQPNDVVDIFDADDQCWYTAILLKQQQHKTHYKYYVKLLIEYEDAAGTLWNNWMVIDYLLPHADKQKIRIHPRDIFYGEITLNYGEWICLSCRSYIDEPNSATCAFNKQICKECMTSIEYLNLYQSIHTSIYHTYLMEIHIIHLITAYSMGIIVSCSNNKYKCSNDISFNSKVDFLVNDELNKQSKQTIYQYSHECNVINELICNKKRRIFCEHCTKTCVERCFFCDTFEIANERRAIVYVPAMFIGGYINYNRIGKYCEQSICYKHKQCDQCYDIIRWSNFWKCLCGALYCYECTKYFGWLEQCPKCINNLKMSASTNIRCEANNNMVLNECNYGQENEWLMNAEFNDEYVFRKQSHSRNKSKADYKKKEKRKIYARRKEKSRNITSKKASQKRWLFRTCSNYND